jgi:hypothetical protein
MPIPVLKAVDCIDHDPISQWRPESDSDVCYSLCLHIGTSGRDGEDLFYVDVATPQAIEEKRLGSALSERSIIVERYSWAKVLERVHAILEACEGADWNQQSQLLRKHFSWEFEDYRPHTP